MGGGGEEGVEWGWGGGLDLVVILERIQIDNKKMNAVG